MALELTTKPDDRELALFNRGASFQHYSTAATEHLAFWASQMRQARAAEDTSKHDIAGAIHAALGSAILANPAVYPDWPPSPFMYERNRRVGLGVLATSWLLRLLIPPGSNFAGGNLLDGTKPVFDAGDNANLLPGDYRIHVTPEAAEVALPPQQTADEWFQQAGIYIRRTSPADPSADVVKQTLGTVDFANRVSLHVNLMAFD